MAVSMFLERPAVIGEQVPLAPPLSENGNLILLYAVMLP